MIGVGFEPTRLAPCDLESHPLDHSGIRSYVIHVAVFYQLTSRFYNQPDYLYPNYFFYYYTLNALTPAEIRTRDLLGVSPLTLPLCHMDDSILIQWLKKNIWCTLRFSNSFFSTFCSVAVFHVLLQVNPITHVDYFFQKINTLL